MAYADSSRRHRTPEGTLGSPYSVKDYYGVNPEFGTIDDFKRLLRQAHVLGFHLIIDLVANHTAWDSRLIMDHPEWFTKDSAGNIIPPNPDWTDVADLNYSKAGLRHYMIEMMKYWVRDVGIDGFRCDVAEQVPTDFWEEARAALDSIKPVMMLSEGAFPEHHLKAFDVTYSWNIYHALAPIMKGEKGPAALDAELNNEKAIYPRGSLRMRFSSNHDENAWDAPDVLKFGRDGAMLAAVIVNTLPGVPLLYNGQEAGNAKKLALFEKDSIDWSKGAEFRKLYTTLFELRKSHSAFFDGGMIRIPTTNNKQVYVFARVSGSDRFIVALNFSKECFNGSMSLLSPDIISSDRIILEDVFTERTEIVTVPASGLLPIAIPLSGYRILRITQSPH
jgi:glycosidase